MGKLGYRFAPIDVGILAHPKAFKAGIEAFGLWAWGVTYVTAYVTGGVIPRDVAMSALGGKDNASLAAKLVTSGLWVERTDGDFDVWNHEKKSAKADANGRTAGAKRTQRWRASKAVTTDTVTVTSCDASQKTSPPITEGVTPSNLSLLGSSSDLSLRRDPDPDRSPWPEWAPAAVESVSASTGETFDLGIVWTVYANGRESERRALSPPDFKKFLGSWASRQKSDRVNGRERRSPKADTRQPLRDPNPEWLRKTGTGDDL